MKVIRQALRDFCGYTTIHGLGRLRDSKYVLQTLFWFLATMGSIGMTIFQIYRLQQQYAAGKLTTSLDIDLENLTFPFFRVCNLNPARYSAVKKEPKLMTILYSTQEKLGVNLTDFDKAGETTLISEEVRNASAAFKVHNITEARSLFTRTLSEVRSEYNTQGSSETNPYSFDFNDIMLSCVFQGQDCDTSSAMLTYLSQDDDLYGTCFEIKATNADVKIAGPEQGLEMMLYINHDEYIPFVPESVGVNTRIYDNQNTNPYLMESSDGVKLPTGFEINIAITMTKYNRIPGNTIRCDVTNQFPNLLSCLESCLADVVSSVCGCGFSGGEEDFTPCHNSESLACRKRVLESIHAHCSHCKQPCNEKKYEQLITMTRWPSRATEPYVKKLLKDGNKTFTDIRDNVLLVRVYFSSLTTQKFTEEIAYTEENFVSDIGGQLGLWVGMSVLTLAEVVELVILMIIGIIEKKEGQTPVEPLHVDKEGKE